MAIRGAIFGAISVATLNMETVEGRKMDKWAEYMIANREAQYKFYTAQRDKRIDEQKLQKQRRRDNDDKKALRNKIINVRAEKFDLIREIKKKFKPEGQRVFQTILTTKYDLDELKRDVGALEVLKTTLEEKFDFVGRIKKEKKGQYHLNVIQTILGPKLNVEELKADVKALKEVSAKLSPSKKIAGHTLGWVSENPTQGDRETFMKNYENRTSGMFKRLKEAEQKSYQTVIRTVDQKNPYWLLKGRTCYQWTPVVPSFRNIMTGTGGLKRGDLILFVCKTWSQRDGKDGYVTGFIHKGSLHEVEGSDLNREEGKGRKLDFNEYSLTGPIWKTYNDLLKEYDDSVAL